MDRGANGGMAGKDVRIIEHTQRKADVTGIDDHAIRELNIGTVAGKVDTTDGTVILIMHQYALLGKGKTIHSAGQIEHFGNDVNDKSMKVRGGLQRVRTIDGYSIPLSIRDGRTRHH